MMLAAALSSRRKKSRKFCKILSKNLIFTVLFSSFISSNHASAQMNTCGNALNQLQQYVFQINQVAQFEIHQGIPMRCQGNPMCGQVLFNQLGNWYSQQTNIVNSYYMEISRQCSSQQQASRLPRRGGPDGLPTVEEDDVTDLSIDNEDKSVRIRIPSNPQGFRPR